MPSSPWKQIRDGRLACLQAGSGFLSQHSKDVLFGLGEAKGPVRASIRWPSGLVQKLRDLPLNHRVWVEEGAEPSRIEVFQDNSGPPRMAPRRASNRPTRFPQRLKPGCWRRFPRLTSPFPMWGRTPHSDGIPWSSVAA